MGNATSGSLLRAIRRVVEDGRLAGLADRDLLHRYLGEGDEAAFDALLRRHGPMVLDVCRSLVPNEADAEDAFQATFLVFAKSSGSIRDLASLAGWLHGVAYRTALKAKAQFARRQKHEASAARPEPCAADELTWREVRGVLHEELASLPHRYQAPLVLCYLQARTQDEAAGALGLAKGTLKGRLERGRALLRARLVRRGLGPAALLAASAWPLPEAAACEGLLAVALGAVPAGAGLVSPRAAGLAEGVMRAMLLGRVKSAAVLGLLSAVLAVGGGTLTWLNQAAGKAPIPGPVPQARKQDAVGDAVRRLVGRLKADPVGRRVGDDQLGLFVMDLLAGQAALVVAGVDPERGYCGSPSWSSDGRRILFDATPGKQWTKTRLMALELGEGGVRLSDLGAGNCPSLSPDGKRIAFLLNAEPGSGEQSGLHVMDADGSGRRRLAGTLIPRWSPDGRHLLTRTFANPCKLALRDGAGEPTPVELAGHAIYSTPSWAGPTTLVAVLESEAGTSLALVDVADPARAKVQETLWRRGVGAEVDPLYPVYSPVTRRCVFVGRDPRGLALYTLRRGEAPRPLEPGKSDRTIASLALSPDGRYVLFCSDRR